MQTETQNETPTFPGYTVATGEPLKAEILAALRKFARQRPGLEFDNYGDVAAYRAESRDITRDLSQALALLRRVELCPSITAQNIIDAAKHSFSGRLSVEIVRRWKCACGHKYTAPVKFSETANLSGEATAWCPKCGSRPSHGTPREIRIGYTTGQYFPTEYRRAVCAVAASVLWDWVRDKAMPPRAFTVAGKKEYSTFEEASAAARDYLPAIVSIEETYRGLSGGDWLRRYFRREFGRGIASRWFN